MAGLCVQQQCDETEFENGTHRIQRKAVVKPVSTQSGRILRFSEEERQSSKE
jgi:hypothetical protein